jgi:antitoxin component YwqK of YwqJK toxin-antitoxin module/Tfp pilus assembly protein PilF
MNKQLFYFIILFFFLFSQKLIAQNSGTDSTNSHLLIEKGISLHDEGKYDEAIRIYNNISKCDPNYWWACYESALSYYDLGKPETALSLCRESEDLNPENAATVALTGSILDDLGKTTEAIAYLKNALTLWPYNQNILYNLAVCYTKSGELGNAEEALALSIRVNPYHKASHLLLAKINFYMGRVAQSYLAYNMAILLNPRVSYINEFEKTITGKNDTLSHPDKYPYPEGTDHKKWDELKWFIQSELSFNEGFEYNYKVSYLTSRQSLMLFKKMSFEPSDMSLYNQFYVRFYSEMMAKNYFETYLNYSFKNTDNKIVVGWLEDNQEKIDEFILWAQTAISNYRKFGFSILNENKNEEVYHYNDNGNLASIGKQKTGSTEQKHGDWLIINEDGGIEEKGQYVDDKLDGVWQIYWPNGQVKQHLIFHEDKLNGNILTYHPNGVIAGKFPFVNGKKEGLQEGFLSSGKLSSSYNYQDGKPNGKNVVYYVNEGYMRESFFVAGKPDGKVTETWLNGAMKSELTAKDSLYEGPARTWYPYSTQETEGFYLAGISSGKFVNYFSNGSKSAEGEYDDNEELTGKRIRYFRNGKVQSEESNYTNGKITGMAVTYFQNGAIRYKRSYKDDKTIKLECFDANGKSLYIADESKGRINFRTYYPDGILETEGDLLDDKRDGKWIIYNPQGKIVQDLMYNDGQMTGKQKKYYDNGVLKEHYSCDSNYIVGPYEEYYSTGQIKTKGLWDKNGRTGEWTSFYSNDSVQSKLFYSKNVRVGRQFFFSPIGEISSDEYFNDEGESIRLKLYDHEGKMQDQKYEYDSVLFKEYYSSGALKISKLKVNNVNHGIVETYFPNGKLKSQKAFIYGLENGIAKRWDYKGNLAVEVPYVMGKRHGLVKGYIDGKLSYTDSYEDDLSQGPYTEYYNNGKLQRITMYVDDQKHGNADYFARDSSFMYRLIYFENVLKAYTYKDAKGNFLPEKPIDLNTREIVCFYPDGKISSRMTLKNGELDGVSKSYHPNGKIMSDKMFSNGNLEGVYKNYFENGNLQELVTFKNDERHGLYELHYESGKKQMTGQYIAGQEEGTWSIYDQADKLISTIYYDNDEIYDIK